ncbi:MAG: DotA/TraY family protein [Deltaproteobacteria bacterium]|jgi:hypothetical protein|nr:DotA/TraY family protein [Deltaproteobacteria bacterium]
MIAELPLTTETPAGDQSARLLEALLGPGWSRLDDAQGLEAAASLIHSALSAFNWLALAAVSLLFILVVAQGAAGAACEGAPLGRRWSSLWTPLRFAGAMAFLAPAVKGLSLFQAGLLLSVGFSVNVANWVWAAGLESFVESGGRLSLGAPESAADDARSLAEGLLKALTVQEYFRQRLDLPLAGPLAEESFEPPAGSQGGTLTLTPAVPPGSGLSPGDLGRLRLPCRAPDETLCRARLSAARGLTAALAPLAASLASLDHETTLAESGLLARASADYLAAVAPWLAPAGRLEAQELGEQLRQYAQAAEVNGWAAAGAYYWTMARLNEKAGALLHAPAVFGAAAVDPQAAALEDFAEVDERLARYLKGAWRPERAASAEGTAAEFPSTAWFADRLSGALGRYALSRLVERLAAGDPVAELAALGRFLTAASETVIGLNVAAQALAGGAAGAAGTVWGHAAAFFSGSSSSFAAGAAGGAAAALGPYLLLASLALMGYGFFLAYFLPALPFVIWLAGVLTWSVMVVEALAAAPLWGAVHALPDGEGWAGQAGRHGYWALLNLLIRPPLMVFGFLAALSLLGAFGRAIGGIFSVFGFAALGDSFLGLSGFLAFALVLGLSVSAAAWKLFGLAVHLPERVMVWVGQRFSRAEEIEEARRVQVGFLSAGAPAGRLVRPAAGGGHRPAGGGPKGP